jgi:hypothetical protein
MKKASFTIGLRSLIGEKSASSKILSNVAVSLAIWLSRIGDPPSTWMVLRQSGTPRETTQVNIFTVLPYGLCYPLRNRVLVGGLGTLLCLVSLSVDTVRLCV